MSEPITCFKGEYKWLSNFGPNPFIYEGLLWPTSEHAYQSEKTLDGLWKRKIREAITPRLAMKLGRTAPQRPDWEEIRVHVMRAVLRAKFSQHPSLQVALVQTGDAQLIEGNTWGDRFWGAEWDQEKQQWLGKNRLGVILMQIRDEYSGKGAKESEDEDFSFFERS